MRYGNKHKDHDYVVARQERYIETYRKGDPKAMMEWMDLEDFEYSDFGKDSVSGIYRKDCHVQT